MTIIIVSKGKLPKVLAGEHGKDGEYVLLQERSEGSDYVHTAGGGRFPIAIRRELTFEVVDNSPAGKAILRALGLEE